MARLSPGFAVRSPPARKLSPLRSHRLALLILALHLALGVAYSVVVPLWEAYDEWGHYPYIRYLATARALPPRGGPIAAENDTASGQPPLYYLLGAAATSWIDTSDWREPPRNRYSSHPTAMGGYNRALHGYDEDFPWRGAVLAVHVARLVSVALSIVTVWFTYLIGRTLFPQRSEIALGAMAICAFWPQFLFIGAAINNDNLVTASAAVLLWFLVRNVVDPGRWRDRLGLVAALGVALAAKDTGLMFLPLVLLGLLASWGQGLRTLRRRQVVTIALAIGGALVAAAAVFVLMHPRYNRARIRVFFDPYYMRKLDWSDLLGAARLMWGTLWASFGWQSVGVADWVYQVVQPVWLAAGAGLVGFFVRRTHDTTGRPVKLALAVLWLAPALVAAGILYRSLFSSYYVTGRYLLSTIAAFSTLLAVGLATLGDLIPYRRLLVSRVVLGLVGAAMLGFAVYAPWAYIAPVYARPAKLPVTVLDHLAHPVRVDFAGAIELAGYELEPAGFRPGDTVKVTLYWRCLREMTANYSLAIKILGRD
jgi:4-amino-4-deoxy-L-arabinose transferase-like glycosyltransferase